MKRMLYCMHVGWNWIKQRPHFIAEELSQYYDVTVISDHSYRIKKIRNKDNETKTLHIKEFYKIPFVDHANSLVKINNYIRKIFYKYYLDLLRPEYLYVMTPKAVQIIPRTLGKTKLIYDCMDDMAAFTENKVLKKNIVDSEKELIDRADLVLVSSQNLYKKLIERYNIINKSKLCIVRNGFNRNSNKCLKSEEERIYKKDEFIFCYFGTIAYWFNFDYFLRAFKEIDNLRLLLIGPIQSGMVIPHHKNIRYIGSVPHNKLEQEAKKADAFTMPFIVNDLIESVDPVKLYEYISFNKNILCVHYSEIDRFKPFVYFYMDYDSFIDQIKKMICNRNVKYSKGERDEFLKENTWKNRGDIIHIRLETL